MAKLRVAGVTGRAMDAWKRINDKPTSITLLRDGVTTLAAQTVRVEFTYMAFQERSSGAGNMAIGACVIFGVAGHPTVVDTDIERKDQFEIDDTIYTVLQVVEYPGEVQARCEAVS